MVVFTIAKEREDTVNVHRVRMDIADEEIQYAKEYLGPARTKVNRDAKRKAITWLPSGDADFLGALGEIVVRRWLGISEQDWKEKYKTQLIQDTEWDTGRHRGDFGKIEVKTTPLGHGRLLVQPHNDISKIYVLVLLHEWKNNVAYLAGWNYGHLIKVPERWMTDMPRPVFGMLQKDLEPMSKLKELIGTQKDLILLEDVL